MRHQGDQLVDGRILKHLKGSQGAVEIVRLGARHKGHVLLHVAGVHVVAVVRELPGIVRHQQAGVRKEADNMVQQGVLGEGAVSRLVAQDPETGADQALNEAIHDPGNGPEGGIRNGGNVSDGSPSKSTNHGNIAHQVAHGDGHRGLKAVLGNGSPNRVDIGEATLLFRQLATSVYRVSTPVKVFFLFPSGGLVERATDIEAEAPPRLVTVVVVAMFSDWPTTQCWRIEMSDASLGGVAMFLFKSTQSPAQGRKKGRGPGP